MLIAGLGRTKYETEELKVSHLRPAELEELLAFSHKFYWSNARLDSTVDREGWRYYTSRSPGLRRWWGQMAQL